MGQEALQRFLTLCLGCGLVWVFLGLSVDRSASANNLIGSAEDFLGALFRDCLGITFYATTQPALDISTTEICTFEAQRFAAKKRHCLCFDFTQTPWCCFSV